MSRVTESDRAHTGDPGSTNAEATTSADIINDVTGVTHGKKTSNSSSILVLFGMLFCRVNVK